jgi:hypothetical protein
MVHPVEDGEQPTADFVDAHAGIQQSGSRAVAASRCSYTIKEKSKLVLAICTLASNGVSILQACPLFGSPHQYYYRFKKAAKAANNLEANDVFVHCKVNGTARKIHPGRPSIRASVLEDLMQYIVRREHVVFRSAAAWFIMKHPACCRTLC